jgi:macrolide-specific efflux system membrane fusion protein
MKLVLRLLIVVLVLGAAGGAAWYYFAPSQAKVAPRTVAAERGDVEQTVLASGVLQASELVSVGAQVSGTIENLAVTLGQTVAKGDLIAEIDSLNQENAVKAAEAALANTMAQKRIQEASAAQAEAALARSTRLKDQNLLSEAEFETTQLAAQTQRAQVDVLAAQIQQAELTVESAKLDLARTRITAPVSGVVVAVVVGQGATVSAQQSAPTIVKIANLDTMIVRAEISEADVPRVAPGQHVYFTILGEPDHQIEAMLLSVEPAPESIATTDTASSGTAVYYNGLFEVPNPDHKLRIAMTAQVTIVLNAASDVITVPSSVLRAGPGGQRPNAGPGGPPGAAPPGGLPGGATPGGQQAARPPGGGNFGGGGPRVRPSFVEVYDPVTETTTRREVVVGLNNNVVAEIKSGLEEGELVVEPGVARPAATGQQGGAALRIPGLPGGGRGFGG